MSSTMDAKSGPLATAAELTQALYVFMDLSQLAHLWPAAPNADHELVAEFRAMRRPFLVVSQYRCRFKCAVCGVQTGDASYHFEDPLQPEEGSTNEPLSVLPPVSGRYVQIEYSDLHAIVAHGQQVPPTLAMFFAEARRLHTQPT